MMRRAARTSLGVLLAVAMVHAVGGRAEQGEPGVIPRGEHPRPNFRRDAWLCLNGPWQFCFDPDDRGLKEQWFAKAGPFDRRIVVPFCWESRASGVASLEGHRIGWYRRRFLAPYEWEGRRVWLRFEAVDWASQVWVNGRPAGRHEGGYTPFALDVTDLVKPGEEATIVVRAFDPTDPETSLGKQGPPWYTPTSGIWQTVWLEARPARHVADFRLTPRRTGDAWTLDVEVTASGPDGPARVELTSPKREFPPRTIRLQLKNGRAVGQETLDILAPKSWSPDSPKLFDLAIRLRDDSPGGSKPPGVSKASDAESFDTVHTYFGLRTIESAPSDSDRNRILLNGEPVYLRGTLDQSFNPEGICTAPSDDFLRRDLELAKQLGVNFLRIHVKADEPRRLYWADRLGLMVMEDMPSVRSDSEKARERWAETMRRTITRDRNHPSVIAWSLFNESWGLGGESYRKNKPMQQWVLQRWEEVKNDLDPTRLVEDDSASLEHHVRSDVNSWRFTIDDYAEARQFLDRMVQGAYRGSALNYVPGQRQDVEPLFVSQFTGVPANGGDRDVSWSLRWLTTLLRQYDLVQGYAYEQLFDVEREHNGLVNFDRTAKAFGYNAFVAEMSVADLQGPDFVGYDGPPVLDVGPEETFTLPVFISHYSRRREAPTLRWQVVGSDNMGQSLSGEPQERQSVWRPYRVMFQQPIKVTVPTRRPFVGAVTLELFDKNDERIAANYVNLVVRPVLLAPGGPARDEGDVISPRVEVLGRQLVALRFSPDDFAAFKSDKPMLHWPDERGRFRGYGDCEVRYRLALPEFVRRALPTEVLLMAELATKADRERLDWPSVRHPWDYPQSEDRKHGGETSVSLEGRPLWRFSLPDDPADSRGVLSHQRRYQHGAHGYLVRQNVDLYRDVPFRDMLHKKSTLELVFRAMPVEEDGVPPKAHGISIYGERLGRFPIDPTLVVRTSRDLVRPPGWISNEPVAVDRLLDRVRRVTTLATAEADGHPWRYVTTRPAKDWASPSFDDSAWALGKNGFGTPGTPGLRVATPWTRGPLWFRARVKLTAPPIQIVLRCFHLSDAEVLVNGKPLHQFAGPSDDYEDVTLTDAQRALFAVGDNTLAIHCPDGPLRPGLDFGLRWASLDKEKPRAEAKPSEELAGEEVTE